MPRKNYVWVVEWVETFNHYDDIVIAHVASSKKKAIEFCKNNPNFEDRITHDWWWRISREEINSVIVQDFKLIRLNPDGTKIP